VPPNPQTDDARFRVLTLDGGGAKGFYTLGVLTELEAMAGRPLHEVFPLVFGTSTGAIIAALIALGTSIDKIHDLYKTHVPTVMRARTRGARSAALEALTRTVFKEATFDDVKTGIGVVATRWDLERPMIFKGTSRQAHGRLATFVPGFGVSIADAVQASCSAYPFFARHIVTTSTGDRVELIDGGYCANNPTLYAIADALLPLTVPRAALRVLSIGVGEYPEPKSLIRRIAKVCLRSVELLQKTFEINTRSMEQLRTILFNDIATIRISDTFKKPELATDLMEHNLIKLNLIFQEGKQSFASREDALRSFLL
jgi:patatin-like phospholipase/acyl hydrolase